MIGVLPASAPVYLQVRQTSTPQQGGLAPTLITPSITPYPNASCINSSSGTIFSATSALTTPAPTPYPMVYDQGK